MAGESGPETEYPEVPIEQYSSLPQEEGAPSPLPGMLYPRESESREVIILFAFHLYNFFLSKFIAMIGDNISVNH